MWGRVGLPLMAFSTKEGYRKVNPAARRIEDNPSGTVLYLALGLSNKRWRLTFGGGGNRRQEWLPRGDLI